MHPQLAPSGRRLERYKNTVPSQTYISSPITPRSIQSEINLHSRTQSIQKSIFKMKVEISVLASLFALVEIVHAGVIIPRWQDKDWNGQPDNYGNLCKVGLFSANMEGVALMIHLEHYSL